MFIYGAIDTNTFLRGYIYIKCCKEHQLSREEIGSSKHIHCTTYSQCPNHCEPLLYRRLFKPFRVSYVQRQKTESTQGVDRLKYSLIS